METTPGVLKISDKEIATAPTAKGSGELALNTLAPALGLDSNAFIPVGIAASKTATCVHN